MTTAKYRSDLPQLGEGRLLTDGGIETTLIFKNGLDLPYFAAFTLIKSEDGRAALRNYYEPYLKVAADHGCGFILDSPTWRASRDWGLMLEYDASHLADANRKSIEFLFALREEFEGPNPIIVSGNVGPRGDGYAVNSSLTPDEAEDYHSDQIATFDSAGVDMVSAITMTHVGEALGIVRACSKRQIPLALSFTVETDGRLPSGQGLKDAIEEVDQDPSGGPDYFMINCAHPDHFSFLIEPGSNWANRIRGLRANASRKSHAELDEADELDEGDPSELAADYSRLLQRLPNIRVFGGCCGTNHAHVRAISEACLNPLAI